MNQIKTVALAGAAIVALLALPDCGNTGGNDGGGLPGVGKGTGPANATQPTAAPGTIATQAPEGGAAARIGVDEYTISKVACTVINGVWSMSGGDDAGVRVAVTGPEDRSRVDTASIVTADGKVAQVSPGKGSAAIVWEGESFTVTGKGELLDLNNPDGEGTETDMVIKATCG